MNDQPVDFSAIETAIREQFSVAMTKTELAELMELIRATVETGHG